MAINNVTVANRAIVMIGANRISSFTDGSTEASVANDLYYDILDGDLTACRWRFATKQTQLSANATAPTGIWTQSFYLPTDNLYVQRITVGGNTVTNYDIFNNELYTDLESTDTVIADYTYRPAEEEMPKYFILSLEYHLASVFAHAIARSTDMASIYEEKYRLQYRRAKNLDSSQQPTSRVTVDRFAKFRGSTSTRY